jgi:hypothetical protein
MKKVKIQDHEELVRDAETQAVLNTDLSSLESYRKHRERIRQKDDEVKTIRQELDEIRNILELLVEKVK